MRNNYHIERSEDSISKISRSKSKNQISIVAKLKKQKETKWNDRFHLEHIPQYNYHNEPQSQYLKNKFRIPNKKNNQYSKAKRNIEPSLEKNKVSNKPNPLKNQERVKQAINKAFSDLKTLWYEKAIPACHMELMTKMFNRQNYPMKILEDIKHEFSQISKETSLVQKIMASIQTRQTCLQKINQVIKQYQQDQLNKGKTCKLFQEKISHLRILTIHCIQCIYQWKQSIQSMIQKKIKPNYIDNGKNYLLKVTQDFYKIANSKMNEIYKFQEKKPDAFFLNYTLDNKKISNVSKNLVKRIRLCEIMLVQDQSNGLEEQKRTPLVQKLKIPPSLKDKSMPPRGNAVSSQQFKKIAIEYGQFSDYFSKLLQKSAFSKSFLETVQLYKYEQVTIFQYSDTGDQIVFASDKYSSQRKLIILAIKSSLEEVQSLFKHFCQYLWEHDNCTQIRLSLVHHQIGDGLSVDSELQKRIKTVGFRWISVNHSNQIRMTVFAIKRPLDMVSHKTARRKQAYPVIIQHLTVFSLEQNNQKKIPNKSQMSTLTIIELLKQLKRDQYDQVCRRDQYFSSLQSIKKIANFLQKQAIKQNVTEGYDPFFRYSGLKAFQIPNEQKIQKIFKNVEVSPKSLIQQKYPQYISLFNSSFKYGSTTINDGKYTKFFPSKQNQILICESNYPIYLLQSDEESINFFIIEVEQGFSMQSIDSIFHAMGQQSSFIDQFWLPNFNKNQQYVDQVGLRNTELISTDYWTCLGSLTRKGKVRTKVIKPPFVFGVIHKRLLQMLQIPLYCTLVGKSHVL